MRKKTILSAILTLVMLFSCAVPAFAVEVDRTCNLFIYGTNTVDVELDIFKVMDMELADNGRQVYYTPTETTIEALLDLYGNKTVTYYGISRTLQEWYTVSIAEDIPKVFSGVISLFYSSRDADEWYEFAVALQYYFRNKSMETPAFGGIRVPAGEVTVVENITMGMYLISMSKEQQTLTSLSVAPILVSLPTQYAGSSDWVYDVNATLKIAMLDGPEKTMSQANSISWIGNSRPYGFIFDDGEIAEGGMMTAGAGQRIDFCLKAPLYGDSMNLYDVMENMTPDSILRCALDYSVAKEMSQAEWNDWYSGLAHTVYVSTWEAGDVVVDVITDYGVDRFYYATEQDFLDKVDRDLAVAGYSVPYNGYIDVVTGTFFHVMPDGRISPEEGENFYGETVYDYCYQGPDKFKLVLPAGSDNISESEVEVPVCPVINVPTDVVCPVCGDMEGYVHLDVIRDEMDGGHFEYHITVRGIPTYQLTESGWSTIELHYSAILSQNAICGDIGNNNTFWFDYTSDWEDWTSTEVRTTVYTYGIFIDKIDAEGKSLSGAQFKLEQLVTDKYWADTTMGETTTSEYWTVVTPGGYGVLNEDGIEVPSDDAPYILMDDGSFVWKDGTTRFTFRGLAEGEYRLTEVVTPDGYTAIDPIYFQVGYPGVMGPDKLENLWIFRTDRVSALADLPSAISDVYIEDDDFDNDSLHSNGTRFDGLAAMAVVNTPGVLLPRTGGSGTYALYATGGVLLLTALVFLRKRRRTA